MAERWQAEAEEKISTLKALGISPDAISDPTLRALTQGQDILNLEGGSAELDRQRQRKVVQQLERGSASGQHGGAIEGFELDGRTRRRTSVARVTGASVNTVAIAASANNGKGRKLSSPDFIFAALY